MWKTLLLCAMVLVVVAQGLRAEQYLCVPEKSTGFHYDKIVKEWDYKRFKTTEKLIISPIKHPYDKLTKFEVTSVGEKTPAGSCRDFSENGTLECVIMLGILHFNKLSGRYLWVMDLGYWTVGVPVPAGNEWFKETDQNSSDVMLQIGRCAPF
jgi:hypothetical protein